MININKRVRGPVCLKIGYVKAKNGQTPSYDCGKVREWLREDFNNKCYLCESKQDDETPFTGGNERIEHFMPHNNSRDLERKYSWTNLFLSCEYCNGAKGQQEDLIDCTSKEMIITDVLKFEFTPGTLKPKIEINESYSDDQTIINTRELLDKIYNKPNQALQLEIANKIRIEAKENFDVFIRKIEDYLDNLSSKIKKEKVEKELSFESPFLAFKICYIKSSPKLMSFLKDTLPDFK